MRVGILADIHANLPALQAVLVEARNLSVERLLVLGDLVGYYYWPAECIDMLDAWPTDMVIGNHEEMLAVAETNEAEAQRILTTYGSGLSSALADLDADALARLSNLPRSLEVQIESRRVLLCHGAPWSTDTYVYPDADHSVRQEMARGSHDLVLFGHTHYPVDWALGSTRIINPGSVGQQRNRRPGAHWLCWDVATDSYDLRVEAYDVATVQAASDRRDPNLPYLSQVLTRHD